MSSTSITLIAKWSYSSDFQFNDNDDGTLSIKSFENKLLTDVIIPTEYKGKKITAIDSDAFISSSSLLNVFIPKTINKISSYAFGGCSYLTIYCESEVKPDSWSKNWNKLAPFSDAFTTVWGVNLIDRQKYNNLYYVKGTLDNAQYIQILDCDDSACEIIVPTNINNIPVTTIANNAFRDKSSLEKIYLPNTIFSIGTNVFKNTNHIVIYCQIESKPNEWDENWNCYRPVIWKHDEHFENSNIINGIKYIKSEINGVNVVLITGADKEIKFVNLPKEIDGIDNIIICNGAFKNNNSIETVQISSGVKEIMDYAFSGCSQISNLIINEGIKKIGDYSFEGCSSISTLIMPDSLCEIGKSAFSRCYKLFSVTMSTNISTIPESCFYKCLSLNNISILPNISLISENAFSYTGLKNIFIPKTVKEIEKYAFIYCNDLSVIYCEDENKPNSWSVNWNRKNLDFTNYEYYNVVWSSKN